MHGARFGAFFRKGMLEVPKKETLLLRLKTPLRGYD